VPPDDSGAGRSLGAKISSECRSPFRPCRDYAKGCHVRGPPIKSVGVAYVDWHGKRMCHVYQVSIVVCTSIQIAVTLRYE
jgi:hypothetical protein